MNDKWEEVLAYLQPRQSEYWMEEPSMTQRVFLRSQAQEVLFGGAAGGGKSSALLMSALQYVDIPDYSAILFRRTYQDLALPGALMDRFKEWCDSWDDVHWNNNLYQATFPSGARISFGYLNNAEDYLRYKGAEFQFVGMDEVTEIREKDYRYLFSRLRRPASGPLSEVPLRMRAATNPAPNWVRRRFLVEGPEKGRIFVPSLLTDNPGIDPESYRKVLQELDAEERHRLEHGDWWATALGTMFDREKFITITPGDVPEWRKGMKLMRAWDLAGTKPTPSNPDPDWTVGVKGLLVDGQLYVLDVRKMRDTGDKVEKFIAKTAAEDGPECQIFMEQEPGSAGKGLVSHYSRHVIPGYSFAAERPSGDKETRAEPLSSAVRNDNVFLVEKPGNAWIDDFIDELCAFPEVTNAHDDQVDAASHLYSQMTGISGKWKKKLEIIV